jgi:hypothetical protein
MGFVTVQALVLQAVITSRLIMSEWVAAHIVIIITSSVATTKYYTVLYCTTTLLPFFEASMV